MQLLLVRINIIELSNSILTSNNSIAELFNSKSSQIQFLLVIIPIRELSNSILTSNNYDQRAL